MKKYFLFALTAIFAINMIAQDETYPKSIENGWDCMLKGVKRQYVSSKMIKDIVAQESESNKNLSVVVQYWRKKQLVDSEWGYDTIARYEYKDGKKVLEKDELLLSDDYKGFVWNLYWELIETAPNDTLKTFRFNYSSHKYLDYYVKSDTSYTAYAGLPYRINNVENLLQLPVTYRSSDLKVASVDDKGLITVAGKGDCMIKALFAGDEEIDADSAEWKLVVKEGDYYKLDIIAKEMTEKTWTSGAWTYHSKGFDRIQVTEANCNDIYGDGKISFDIATRTLTFNNYQRTYSDEEDSSMGWSEWLGYQSGPLPLNIKIIGECAIRHNSAGFMCGWDMNIIGENGSKLTLEGRFPQLSTENQLRISGCEVHAWASTPHPLMHCEILRVDNNSYFESKFVFDDEMGLSEDAWEYGARAIEGIQEIFLGDNMALYPEDAKVGQWEGEPTIIDAAGHPVLAFEIAPKKGTAIENVEVFSDNNDARKLLHNGQIFILHGDHIYTLSGQKVK